MPFFSIANVGLAEQAREKVIAFQDPKRLFDLY